MGLQDDILAEQANQRKGPLCQVGMLMETMSDSDKEVVLTAFSNPRWTASGIVRALQKNGFGITIHSVQRHRRGDCQCRSQTT